MGAAGVGDLGFAPTGDGLGFAPTVGDFGFGAAVGGLGGVLGFAGGVLALLLRMGRDGALSEAARVVSEFFGSIVWAWEEYWAYWGCWGGRMRMRMRRGRWCRV